MAMWLVVPFALIFGFLLLGGLFLSMARLLGRILLSASIALLIGVITAVALTPEGDGGAIGALVALALIAPTFWLLTPRRTQGQVVAEVRAEPSAVMRRKGRHRSWFFRQRQDSWLDTWSRLEDEASDHAARLSVAKRSCERFEAHCEKRRLDLDSHRSLIIIRKRVPTLINHELDRAQQTAGPRRTSIIEGLVDLVERVAADCEKRQLATRSINVEEDALLRRHVENYLAGDTLSPLKP